MITKETAAPGWTAIIQYGAVAAATVAALFFIDVPVARWVQAALYGSGYWKRATGDLPDLLLPSVVLAALAGSTVYAARTRRRLHDRRADLALLVAVAAPASFLVKSALKLVFGRVTTREWLQDHSLYGFHWLQGTGSFSGFPSGHMAVFTTLAAICWRIYPETRRLCLGFLLLLGAALVLTNYHFVSDVFAGAAVGLLLENFIHRILSRRGLIGNDPA